MNTSIATKKVSVRLWKCAGCVGIVRNANRIRMQRRNKMKAWYFSSEDRKLRYGDNRIIKAGLTHKVTCKPVLCEAGLHGSKRIIDALFYAPGPVVWRVELGGDMAIGDDKISATERHYLWGV